MFDYDVNIQKIYEIYKSNRKDKLVQRVYKLTLLHKSVPLTILFSKSVHKKPTRNLFLQQYHRHLMCKRQNHRFPILTHLNR